MVTALATQSANRSPGQEAPDPLSETARRALGGQGKT
jgi:hypothetical protein